MMRRRCEGSGSIGDVSGERLALGPRLPVCPVCAAAVHITYAGRLYAHQRAATAEERAAMGVMA